MTKTTYTMFVENDAGHDEIVARGVTAGAALSIAIRRGGAGDPEIVSWREGSHRFYAIFRDVAGKQPDLVIAARGPLSADEHADDRTAAALFERAFLSEPGRFWDGAILSDEEYARRQRHERSAS